VRVTNEDTGYDDDIFFTQDGKPDPYNNEFLPSWVMCVLDSENRLFVTDEHANVVAMFSTSGDTLGYWGEHGEGAGQLNGPSGIALDADENLWVVSSRNHRVEHFTREGEYLGGWGEHGTEPGQFSYPWGVAVDPVNGTILVADWRNDRIQRFSPEGEALQVIGKSGTGEGELNRPGGVVVDKFGDIYVADRSNHRVLMFNHRGMFVESLLGDAVMNERAISKLMTNPDMLRMRDNIINLDREKRLMHPTSVRVDDEGRIYVVDSGRYRIQVYRKLCRVLGPEEVDPPTMHIDPILR
jgi:DNA-binding beta-propeller fold protein YncE